MDLDRKRLLITGVTTRDSIAFSVAAQAQELGAEVVLTSFGRARRMAERAAQRLPQPCDVLELDVNDPDHHRALGEELDRRWSGLDGAVHAIAHAPADAMGGEMLGTPAESAQAAFLTSAYSLSALARTALPLLRKGSPPGGSIVGLDFDASVAWPNYNWMGVAKAALESVSRYAARDLGPHGVRVNLVACGPLRTPAAGGVPGFDSLARSFSERAPLGWDPGDPGPVARAVCFLLSDWARPVSGEVLHVDGGYHAVEAGPPLDSEPDH